MISIIHPMTWQGYILNEIASLSSYFFNRMNLKGIDKSSYNSVLNKIKNSYNIINENMRNIKYDPIDEKLFNNYKKDIENGIDIFSNKNNFTAVELAALILAYAINKKCICELLFRIIRDTSVWRGKKLIYLCGEYNTSYEWGLYNLNYKYKINSTIFNEIINSFVNVCKNECPVRDYNTTQLAFYISIHIILSDKDINNAIYQFINDIHMRLQISSQVLYNPYLYPQFVNLADYQMCMQQCNYLLQNSDAQYKDDDFGDSLYNSRCESTYDMNDYQKTFDEYNQDIEYDN